MGIDMIMRAKCRKPEGLTHASRNASSSEKQLHNFNDGVSHLQLVQLGPEEGLMHEDLLNGIACSRVVCFGVHNDAAGLVDVSSLVNVDVADAVRVAHDRDLGVLLDAGHQRVPSAGDHLYNEAHIFSMNVLSTPTKQAKLPRNSQDSRGRFKGDGGHRGEGQGNTPSR